MQARFSILKTFLEAGDGFCTLDYDRATTTTTTTTGDLSNLTIRLDRAKILSHGRPAVERYLQQLHVYKSTADLEAGRRLYEAKTKVEGEFWQQGVRNEVIQKKMPRKVFCMANTVICEDGNVVLKEYAATPEGLIQSWVERDV